MTEAIHEVIVTPTELPRIMMLFNNTKRQSKKVSIALARVDRALRALYKLDRLIGEGAATHCILALENLIATMRDGHDKH